MDAPCKIQGSIHVFRLVNNMCPGKWVHITWDIVLIFIYFATIQLRYIICTRECCNLTKECKNQSVEIEFWDIESEDIPELEESDIPGVYFNEFREYVDENGNVLSPSDLDAIRYKDDYEDDYYR